MKGCMAGILDQGQGAADLAMVDDRNLAVNTYNEDLARETLERLPKWATLLQTWLDGMKG